MRERGVIAPLALLLVIDYDRVISATARESKQCSFGRAKTFLTERVGVWVSKSFRYRNQILHSEISKKLLHKSTPVIIMRIVFSIGGKAVIKSIHKASVILKILSDSYPDGVKLERICADAGINKSTCVRILDSLIEEQLAERMQFAVYRLGAGCFHLTRSGKFDGSRLSVCRPVLKWLHKMTENTVLISEIQNGTKYTVEYFESDIKLTHSFQDILVDDIYRTAAGRLMMSRLDEERLGQIISRHGLPTSLSWKDFSSVDDLRYELEKISKMPVVYNATPIETGDYMCGLAAEIKDKNGMLGALGIAYISDSVQNENNDERKRLTRLLLRAAREMNRRLCFENDGGSKNEA